MKNLIQLLPDAIANQIAAGEVVQRPASVLKELLENAIDAEADCIDVVIKNAGKSLVQVTDNGRGMSSLDSRMCFERHATSKIRNQSDLFNIRTLGFRGEALASIAAVAQVQLKSRQGEDELGTLLEIEASEIKKQEPAVMPIGTTFQVKNLFFNVPARRNFLKSNPVETRHLLNEFIRVAIPHPEIEMSFRHNETQVYELKKGNLEERLHALFGNDLRGKLTHVQEETGYAKLSGFLGTPDLYRKYRGDQFFFVNGRYIKSNYLNHSIVKAYQEFIPEDTYPFYCIFIEIDPEHVDINIHPTKTEVKFDDERTLYVLLQGIVKQGLGALHQAPEYDFEKGSIQSEIYGSSSPLSKTSPKDFPRIPDFPQREAPKPEDWDALYRPERPSIRKEEQPPFDRFEMPLVPERKSPQTSLPIGQKSKEGVGEEPGFFVQFKNRFVLTERNGKLLIIDQSLAHQRILFEKFLNSQKGKQLASQQLLFPQTIEFTAPDYAMILDAEDALQKMGFELKEFGRNTLIVYGSPAGIPTGQIREIFDQILGDLKILGASHTHEKLFEGVAKSVSARSAVTSSGKLSIIELKHLVEDLFRCEAPAYSPSGKPTFKSIDPEELSVFFS
ncbi:MAG: DNA mismatch repair endonuclease MutL [Bacteroidota bacterium]